MNFWPGFYSLQGAWYLLLLLPLIIFYFLKLKRPHKRVPSLALWSQVINDRRVNSPFQKFKRSILLLLQILLLLFLVLSLMQPFIQSGAERAEYLPILIDCSASMGATDPKTKQTRLDLAKEQVTELIDNLLPDQRVSLVAVSSTARRLTDFTDNQRVLKKSLAGLTVDDVPSRLEDALRMTQALSRTAPIKTVLFYSDGNFPEEVNFELPFELNYQRLPSAGANLGITSFNARKNQDGNWDVFIRIENSSDTETPATIELLQDGQAIAKEDVVLGTGDSQRLEFSVNANNASSLEAVLVPGAFDSLLSDNRAFLKIPQARSLLVFIDPDLSSYRYALADNKEVELYPEAGETVGLPEYDLIISASEKNLEKQALVKLGVGFVPEDLKKYIQLETKLTDVVDWNRSSSLLRHVELNDVQITEQPVWEEDAGVENLEELGYEVLVHGRLGPLLLQKRNAGDLEFYFLFNTDRSTMPYRVGFPIMVSNLLQLTMQEAGSAEVQAAATPVLPAVEFLPEKKYEIKTPDGKQLSIESNQNGLVSGIAALRVGKYTISGEGANSDQISVSLLNPLETSLVSVEEIQFSEVPVTASQAQIDSDKPLWSEFAIIAFVLLLVEWWYFQRRPAGIPS
ncbi:VWA domain-containing protein [uncultured Gimesia sp.]|uniref:vWA domain-containing protein n=1 Tax=uncultured Gimesia sp. TaxID=1678688 RepID=UPI0030D86795|tara:strand:- start:160028 stop:161911 length:1884 start_codon:yes stop_codon:yes gene_type:complete